MLWLTWMKIIQLQFLLSENSFLPNDHDFGMAEIVIV